MMRFLTSCLVLGTISTAAIAQDQPNTILVIDGSGSMWGQIDEVAKITIAQEVVAGLLSDFPADEGLGLTVYGHRERGNCTDIETIVAPAPGTADDIINAVNGITPLGKTPMTDAVIAAAEALRYTEDSATVILVSDGVETCNPDPCAAARLLEEAGINFTAHVVGFDVSDPEALTQMQCIAEETGGQFLTASNADELDLAMTAMVTEPEPIIVTGVFEARIGDNAGLLVEDPIIWDLTTEVGTIVEGVEGNPFTTELTEGTITATAYRVIDEMEATATFDVTGANDVAVTVIFPEVAQTATVTAPETAVGGSRINVDWTGPDNASDQIIVTGPGQNRTINFVATSQGTPAALRMPVAEGTYDIHYNKREGTNEFLATTSILVTPVTATIDAPDEGIVGETINVGWTGPDYEGDMIIMAQDGGSSNIRPKLTATGNPIAITLPGAAGLYEIRYRLRQGGTIIASKVINVTGAQVGLTAPDTAVVAETITVEWIGPDYDLDYISVGIPGENAYEAYTYTREGNPLQLQMPAIPGDYELRYVLNKDREVLITQPITVTEAEVGLIAPDTAAVSSQLTVGWIGPDYDGDYISVGKPGERYENYTYTEEGSPLALLMPAEPGDYELRYHLYKDGEVIMTQPITVTAVAASITAPDTAAASSQLTLEWTGPDYDGDYIGVGKPGESYENYTYTEDGSPLELLMPTEPGDYELRYHLAQDGEVIATRAITITAVKAAITAPDTANASETLTLTWEGPDYRGDYISVGPIGSNSYENYTYTADGDPLALQMPPEPGDYEIRYQLAQDGVIIYRHQISILPVTAELIAPDSIAIGDALVVGWDGPDYQGDYIGIAETGATGYLSYAYTRDGNPVTVRMPETPGDYELRYFLGQDGVVIGTRPITVTK